MLMKYIISIIPIVLFSLFILSSCSQNEVQIEGEHGPLQFSLNVMGGSSVTRATGTTYKAFVFIYKAEDTTSPLIQLEDELNVDNAILYYTPANDFVREASYNVFAVATTDATLQETLKSPMSQINLLNIIQSTGDLGTDGDEYMITGGLGGVTFNNSSKSILLFRNICQLQLTVTDQTPQKYKLITASFEAPDQTYIFASSIRGAVGIPNTAADALRTITFSKTENVYTNVPCYFFEKNDGLTLNIQAVRDGDEGEETFNYKVILAKTERNTIYQINAGLNLTGIKVKVGSSIDWSGTIHDSQEVLPE